MTGFISKPIVISQTIGERLAKVRSAQGLSLAYAARACGIRAEYLSAIETGQYNDLPGEIYGREFIKTYARFLSVNPQEAAAEYFLERQGSAANVAIRAINPFRHSFGSFNDFFSRVFAWRAGMFLASAGAFLFLVFFLRSFLALPTVAFSSPAEHYFSPDGRVILSGRGSGLAELELNGTRLAVDEQGFFKETLSLAVGTTLLKLEGRDRFGRQRTFWRAITVPETPVVAEKSVIR